MKCSTANIGSLKSFLDREKTRLLTACVAVFIWGLVAHAYGFLNLSISHDSLYELYVSKEDVLCRVEVGRFMVPIYQLVFHGRVTLPWLNGLLSLCWLSVSVWLTASIFSIADKFRIALLAGIFTANITVTALTATYIHDLDADMFAVLLAVLTVYLWHRGGKMAWLGIPLTVLVLGLYQSTLSVSIALVMFVSILALLQGEKASETVRKGLQFIVIIVAAGALYLLAVKLSCIIVNTELSSGYNGLTNLFKSKGGLSQYIRLVMKAYLRWLIVFSRSSREVYQMILLHSLLAAPTVIAIIHAMCKKTLARQNKALILILGALLPLGMNIACVLDGGMVHELMLYAAWLIYFFAILLTDWYSSSAEAAKNISRVCSAATIIVLVIILAIDVQTANNAYVKKDLQYQATLSIMTAVNTDMGKTDGYVAGETEVIFIGGPQTDVEEFFQNVIHIRGMSFSSPITYTETYTPYFKYVLQTPLLQSEDEIPEDITSSMAAFPQEGYISWYDGMLVVKLSD